MLVKEICCKYNNIIRRRSRGKSQHDGGERTLLHREVT